MKAIQLINSEAALMLWYELTWEQLHKAVQALESGLLSLLWASLWPWHHRQLTPGPHCILENPQVDHPAWGTGQVSYAYI